VIVRSPRSPSRAPPLRQVSVAFALALFATVIVQGILGMLTVTGSSSRSS